MIDLSKRRLIYIYLLSISSLIQCASDPCSTLYKKHPAFYAYIIGDISSDRIYHEHASEVYATPASCQKVVTALIALKTLGSDYRYVTNLSVSKTNEGVIHNTVISFSGDPTLTSEQLEQLLKPLQNNTITGTLFLDASAFKTSPYSTNIMMDDPGTSYAQPISAINIDKNIIEAIVQPTEIDKPAQVQTNIAYRPLSTITTSADSSQFSVLWENGIMKAYGIINKDSSPVTIRLSPLETEPFIACKIVRILDKLHINVNGRISIVNDATDIPTNTEIINKIVSAPLKDIIAPALKQSDNFVFDCLYLTIIHAHSTGTITNWNAGTPVIKELLQKHFAIDFENAVFVDGSGLSRYNCIQPKKLLQLLKCAYSIPEFMHALATPGEENSTLAKRTTLPSTIKAKTGNMGGISCLCGYDMQEKTPKAFVIMVNSFGPPLSAMFTIIDTFIKDQCQGTCG